MTALAFLCVFAFLVNAAALVPLNLQSRGPRHARVVVGTPARSPAVPHLVSPSSAAALTVQVATTLPIMYGLMSFSEYVTHRYYQHADVSPIIKSRLRFRGGGHVEHHAETLDDMSLKQDARWKRSPASLMLDSDPYRGTAFTWGVTFIMFLQLVVTCFPVLRLLGWSPLATIVCWIVPSLLTHTLIWNALHPAMHGLPDIPLSQGPPGRLLARFRQTKLFRWLYLNHVGHHVVGGVKNYNVCCPGVDMLANSYVPPSVWRGKLSPTDAQLYLS